MTDDFHRIRRLPPYVFEHINPIKRSRAGVDIIDLGMGNPDLPTPQHIVDKLKETVKDPARTAIRRARVSQDSARRRRAIMAAASA